MLRSIKELIGYPIQAVDGEIGKVSDFIFDDRIFGIRYMVASTGSWLAKRKVLISPHHLLMPDTGVYFKHFPVNLTKQRIEDSPPLEKDAPVSLQYEEEYARYYSHPAYWRGANLWGLSLHPVESGVRPPSDTEISEHEQAVEEIREQHLRSVDEVIGYHIEATDGDIGHVEDFIADTDDWRMRHLVVDTRNILPGKKVLVGINWINEFNWAGGTAGVALSKEQIKAAPEFDPGTPVNRSYEEKLYDFYGQPHYW